MLRYNSNDRTLKPHADTAGEGEGTLLPGEYNSTLKNNIHDDSGTVNTDLGITQIYLHLKYSSYLILNDTQLPIQI